MEALAPHAPLKIGYVLKRFPRLSETFILNEMLELERQGVQVHVFSLLHPPAEPCHGLLDALRAEVIYLPRASALDNWKVAHTTPVGRDKQAVARLIEPTEKLFDGLYPGKASQEAALLSLQAMSLAMLASARDIDHLHAHFASNATTVALLAGRISGTPYSFTAHARDIFHTYVDAETDDALRRRKIAEARFVVTVSEYNRRYLARLVGEQEAGKVQRLYNGIDLKRFTPLQGADRDPVVFLAVGRLVEKKGFTHLVEACRRLHASGNHFRCEIVGEGPLHLSLLDQIHRAGLDEVVSLHSAMPQEALLERMRSASVVVLPSVVAACGDRDALPTVLLEGLAMGLPAISTDVSGITEIIEHGQSGLVVPPANPSALSRAMARLLADPALRARFGHHGRQQACRRFDLAKNVSVLRRFFWHSVSGETFGEMPADDLVGLQGASDAHRISVCR